MATRWASLGSNRWIIILFAVQILAVLYFFSASSSTLKEGNQVHHHVVNVDTDQRGRHYFMLVGILSDRASASQREAVRDTWLQLTSYSRMLHKFVIGQPYCVMHKLDCDKQTKEQEALLEEENAVYNDILRVNVLESYNTLSEKMCALMEWASMQSFDYFLKTDHDIFLRLDTIYTELKAAGPRERYWSGLVWKGTPPIRDPTDKNRDIMYDLGKFPPYTAGALHILSADLVRALSTTLARRYYQNEDQSLGIWLIPHNITPIHDMRVQQWDVCHNDMIAKHPLNPQRMRDMYTNVAGGDAMCRGFDTVRCPLCHECSSYLVDWRTSALGCDPDGVYVKGSIELPTAPLPTPVDTVMAGVIGYLPYVSCKRREIEDIQFKYNYVRNGHLNRKSSLIEWGMKGGVDIADGGMADHVGDPSESCVKLSPSSIPDSPLSLISQVLEIGQKNPEALVFSAWSKAENVDVTQNPEDYAIFANIMYTDGSDYQGFTLDFALGSHDWEYNVRVFSPERPVARVELFCIFRFHTGTVWFDNISVSKLSQGLCDLKFQSELMYNYLPATLTPTNLALPPPKPPSDTGLSFILIWTTPTSSFLLRHRRVIESIFYHHPDAHVKMYSNTLPIYFFQRFNSAGYRIDVIRYDLASLSAGLPGERWVGRIQEWQQGESFYAHLADYLRFALLFREGGVYSDMDSILVRPIDQKNIIGLENCDEEILDWCIKLPQFDPDTRYYLPIGFLVLEPYHPLIYGALSFFDTRYDPALWPCGTVYLTLSYAALTLGPQSDLSRETLSKPLPVKDDINVKILPREAFYPVPWQTITTFFMQDDPGLWSRIEQDSYAIHIWGKVTTKQQPAQGSLAWRALNQFLISNAHSTDTQL